MATGNDELGGAGWHEEDKDRVHRNRHTLPLQYYLGKAMVACNGAVPSTLHQLLRFPTEHGIEEVRGDQLQAKNCSMAAMKSTCSIRESEKAEIEGEDAEVLEDVDKEPAEKSEEALKKILVREGDEECFFLFSSNLAEEEG